uniref:Chromosome 14 open reading frame 39 n=1 Tax=Bos mutus grunniens TaxID=30521 RepID=A0A8C0A7M0_BOSMU
MNDSLFVSLDRLFFQYEQDISTKEDIVQRINKCFEDIKEYKATVCKIHETINTTDEEIGHYCKHSKEIKDNCSNWKPTCDVFHKHEDYMQEQFIIYQETIEKDKKMYHGYICQYKDVLKQYQLKYSETPLSREYYEKKREYEEIQNRVLASTEQLKVNETIFMEFLVPSPFPSLTSWTLHMVNLRYKTQDILKHANQFSKRSCDLKKEVDDMEIEINYLNQQIARHYEMKNLPETLEEKNKNVEKRKELKERIFEKDPQPVLMLNKTLQNSQLFLPYESQKLIKPIKMHSSEPRIIDAECGDKGTIRQLPESKCASQITYAEHFGKPIESNSDEVEERAGIFPRTPEIPLFLRTPEDVKAPDSVGKLPKTPSIEINRNTATESQTQKDSPGFSFLMRNLFGKPEREDAFTFSFPSDSSTHTFGAGRDDFSFPFSLEQDQNSGLSSVKGFSSSSQNTTQFTFF